MTKKPQKITIKKATSAKTSVVSDTLLEDLRSLIDQSRTRVSLQVNAELVALYWHIGEKIQVEILKQTRAEYGKQVIATLGRQLTREYGRGFDRTALTRMVRFAELF